VKNKAFNSDCLQQFADSVSGYFFCCRMSDRPFLVAGSVTGN